MSEPHNERCCFINNKDRGNKSISGKSNDCAKTNVILTIRTYFSSFCGSDFNPENATLPSTKFKKNRIGI